jgi:predicted flap endonuclease-1-like 5' DNA nuclease
MSHLVLELALWIILAFFVGCIIGCLLRKLFGGGTESVAATRTPPPAAIKDEPWPGAETAKASRDTEEPLPVTGRSARPQGIAAARDGRADNLQRISGIGPKNEKTLHGLGFFHFDQIAAWTDDEVAWVDDHLKFNGRIRREEWIDQARLLAEGQEEEFHRLYGTGGVKNEKGESESGARTRKD